MPAIKVYTSTGWQDVAQQGKPAEVYEQPNQPATPSVGAIWIDTDASPAAGAQLGPPLVTTLPTTNLYDGQEVQLLVDATNSVIWRLRYRADPAVPVTSKWEFVGGPPLFSYQASPSAPLVTGSWTSPTDWPAITIPLVGLFGDWLFESGCRLYNANVRSTPNFATFMAGYGAAQVAGMTTYNPSVGLSTIMMRGKAGGMAPASWPYRLGYAIYGATPTLADVTYDNAWISVRPFRCGFPPS